MAILRRHLVDKVPVSYLCERAWHSLRRRRCRRLGFGRPVSDRRFDEQAHADRLGRDLDSADLAVDDGPDALHIGFELALRNPRGLSADAAEVLGLTLTGDLITRTGFLTG